jgi:hypothetical protein
MKNSHLIQLFQSVFQKMGANGEEDIQHDTQHIFEESQFLFPLKKRENLDSTFNVLDSTCNVLVAPLMLW